MIVKGLIMVTFGATKLAVRYVLVPILISAATAVALEKLQAKMQPNHMEPMIKPAP